MKKMELVIAGLLVLLFLAACESAPAEPEATVDVQASVEAGVAATGAAAAAVDTAVASTVAAQALAAVDTPTVEPPATFTGVPETATHEPTATEPATSTPFATEAPSATATIPTNTPIPTETPVPPTETPATAEPTAPPPPPTVPPDPVFGADILPNDSFEGGWYNMWGVPELQLPNGWVFEWDEGPTGYGGESWDQWYRPETRVLPYFQLPENERGLFVQDGDYTIKIFKGYGPISFRLYRDVPLEAGTYRLTIRAFPDLVMDYSDGNKVWAGPDSGEVRLITPDGGTAGDFPALGVWNSFEHTFTLAEPGTVRIGAGIRARYGLVNNGWFLDDWSLQRAD